MPEATELYDSDRLFVSTREGGLPVAQSCIVYFLSITINDVLHAQSHLTL